MGTGTSIGRVRGLGSAKHGAHHWWRQRVTAGSNLFLTLWFVFAIARMPGYDYASVHSWLQNSWAAVPMMLLIVSVFYHFRLGLQVVIEDYQHEQKRVAAILLLNFFTVATAATAIFAILKVAFGAAA
ncbi:succinate dehydrogenase, hydrophobic membrane anchor protein [Sphingomonas melonis]|jgi:succinate dehydrogenase / fumarate reductase membrane anchor subunit|uniref:Succinate dehydrogenase hydrophobic membrane anchor subunit n=1 Tax=Sphingomonas melonis TaxID=152682 RepID=A0A7Y9FN82_9SPHN|nr:succinate dehydrogenase, hydrophobic membrane anchor protein [Sphingomonas melonis]NYD90405.1 succinate dehydrogenase / fumarate reductase membrane anchor subunit [Sphingomonas melonis]